MDKSLIIRDLRAIADAVSGHPDCSDPREACQTMAHAVAVWMDGLSGFTEVQSPMTITVDGVEITGDWMIHEQCRPIILIMDLGIGGKPDRRHPEQVMKDLGITYAKAEAMMMQERWVFYDCEGVPANLPEWLFEGEKVGNSIGRKAPND